MNELQARSPYMQTPSKVVKLRDGAMLNYLHAPSRHASRQEPCTVEETPFSHVFPTTPNEKHS